MTTTIAEIDGTNFDAEVASSEGMVLVEFYSVYCGPCREMLSLLAEIAEERGLKVLKVDAIKEAELAARFGVKAVPNFVAFRGGVPVGQRLGRVPKRELLAWVDGLAG